MSTKAITLRLDEDTIDELKKFAKSVGLSMNALAAVVLKQAAREREIVLDGREELVPSPYLEKRLMESEFDIKHGRNLSREYSSIEEMLADLENDCVEYDEDTATQKVS